MPAITELNKIIVQKFNKECIEQGDPDAFRELLAGDVINHSAPPGMPRGVGSFTYFLNEVLRKGFPNLRVEILDQVAENDLVATRKRITGTHTGEIFGIPPSNKDVVIHVIDIIRLENGQYAEHWGQSNFADVLKEIGG
ncbi:MAG: ester cyclase [Chitinophagaceae bacterium]|nr:ester cyclase [Chitinophagaceae bacterium]